jgi:Flp pilus assembly pilin Flp
MYLLPNRKRRRSKRGQGISEYGAMLAFVAILVSLCFSITNSSLKAAVSAAYSSISNQLNSLSSSANDATS